MSRAPLTSPSASSRVTDVASSPAQHVQRRDTGLDVVDTRDEQALEPSPRLGLRDVLARPRRNAQVREVGLRHRRAQLVAADALPLPADLRARGVRDQRQHPGNRGAVRVAGVVQLHAAADLELADAGGGVEQARDGGVARHLDAHRVVAGLHREDPWLRCGRPGERLHALDDVGTLQRAADLRAGGAVGDLDDHRRPAVAVVVRNAEELLVEQVAAADHAADQQQHRERRRGEPPAPPLGPLPQIRPAGRQLLPARREHLRAARHRSAAQRPDGWWSALPIRFTTSERNRRTASSPTPPGDDPGQRRASSQPCRIATAATWSTTAR